MKKLNKESVFDTLMNHLMGETDGDKMLEECMAANTALMRRVPLRYRLIALGFAKGQTLEELNESLDQEGCARLYSRSLWEASLIFAFLHGLTYHQWKELQEICHQMRDEQQQEDYF